MMRRSCCKERGRQAIWNSFKSPRQVVMEGLEGIKR